MKSKDIQNREIENRIKESVSKITPDIIDSIISDCETEKGVVIQMTEKKSKKGKYIGIAAAFAIMIGGIFGYQGISANALASVVSLDVNPSVEIEVNKREEVIDVIAMNDDGRKIIGDMNFKGSDLDVALNALIGSMLRNGYINELQNSILISVDGKDQAESAALQKRLTEEVNAILGGGEFQGAVISQTVTASTELETLASQYGITTGKAKLIQDIIAKDATHTFEELAPLTINELNLMVESGVRKPEAVQVTGKASDKSYIGAAKAKEIALADAGVAAGDIWDYGADFDYEYGVMVYEIEFDVSGYEYEYDVNATTGEIVWSNKKTGDVFDDDWYHRVHGSGNNSGGQTTEGTVPTAPVTPDTSVTPSTGVNDEVISVEAAKTAALNHAGIAAADVRGVECELDREGGMIVYEVEFDAGYHEYSYDIDAVTGEVLRYEKEFDD